MFSTYEDNQGVMSAVPSLKSMSMVKVAVSICTGGALKKYIPGLSSLLRKKRECLKEKKFRTAIEKLNVPNSLLDPLANQTLQVALGMSNWAQSLKGHFDLNARYCTRMLAPSMFLSNGKIDKMKVAEKLVKVGKVDVSERFKIACFHWLEDSMVDFWGQMTGKQRRAFTDTGRSRNVPHDGLAFKVARELEKGGGLVFSDEEVVREVIKCATTAGSEVAVRHLWSQLDPAEVQEIAKAMIGQLPLCRSYDYRTEEFADILCFLLPNLKDEVKLDIIVYHADLFDMLVSANRIHVIRDIMSTSMQYITEYEFVPALRRISTAFTWPDKMCQRICCDDYRELLKKIWTQSPAYLKKSAITQTTSLWLDLLFPTGKDRDMFAFFLEDATREEKLDMIFSNGGETGLICLGFRGDLSLSNFLLQLLNLSQDEKRKLLKREIRLHDPLICYFDFGLAAQYCLQFEDEETKAEYKRMLVGDRIEEICIYILRHYRWTKLDNLLYWYFSTDAEIIRFMATLWEMSGPDIRQRMPRARRCMLVCYARFGLDPNVIHNLKRAVLTLARTLKLVKC